MNAVFNTLLTFLRKSDFLRHWRCVNWLTHKTHKSFYIYEDNYRRCLCKLFSFLSYHLNHTLSTSIPEYWRSLLTGASASSSPLWHQDGLPEALLCADCFGLCSVAQYALADHYILCFPGGSGGEESACSAGDPGWIPGSGRSPGEGNGHPLQYSCLENSMDRGSWWATVQGVTKSQTWLCTHTHIINI